MLYAIVTVIILILDQWLKYWTSSNLVLDEEVRQMIPKIFHLTNTRNTGIAFGLFGDFNMRWIVVMLAVVFSALIVLMLVKRKILGGFGRWTAVMVLAGALGNAIDRAVHGYVVDMIEVEFMSFPVFNIADICLTVGGVLFCLYIIFHKDPEPQVKKSANAPRRVPAAPIGSVGSIEQLSRPNADEMTGRLPSLGGAPRPAQGNPARPQNPPVRQRPADRPEQRAEVPEPRISQAPRPAAPPVKRESGEFSLDDILAEFGDK